MLCHNGDEESALVRADLFLTFSTKIYFHIELLHESYDAIDQLIVAASA